MKKEKKSIRIRKEKTQDIKIEKRKRRETERKRKRKGVNFKEVGRIKCRGYGDRRGRRKEDSEGGRERGRGLKTSASGEKGRVLWACNVRGEPRGR